MNMYKISSEINRRAVGETGKHRADPFKEIYEDRIHYVDVRLPGQHFQ
jgi:hypothetical protein